MDWTIDGTNCTVTDGNFFRRTRLTEDIENAVDLEKYNNFKVITRENGFDCYINGQLVQSADLPAYPAIAATAATDDGKVIIKAVNITDKAQNIELALDCPVKSDYELQLLTGDSPDAVNTLDAPLAVAPVTESLTGAAQSFTYEAPAYSFSILTLTK
jgi:alpha-L-arabinofuranosidase